LFVGLGVGLVVGLINAVDNTTTMGEMEEKIVPNQGIRNSARNAVFYGLLPWLFVAAAATSIAGRPAGPFNNLTGVVLGVGALLALSLLSRFGGNAVLRHYTLRALLVRTRCMPWNYPAFLDYSTDLLLIYKIGGGYRFRHELLQEYFASLSGFLRLFSHIQDYEQFLDDAAKGSDRQRTLGPTGRF